MLTRWNDSRLVLLFLAGEAVEATGARLLELWRRSSRSGRLHRELHALEAGGLIQRVGTGKLDERVFRLTVAGRQVVTGAVDPEKLWSRGWDGQWRLVLFDVPQAQSSVRNRLRRQLREMRFGWLQNSVWLTPDPLNAITREFAQDSVSVESLLFLEARPVGGENDAELVAGAWDFVKLAALHADYLRIAGLRPVRERRNQVAAWAGWAQIEERAWAQIARLDPLLPEPLWPAGYAGRTAWKARMESQRAASEAFTRLAPRE